MRSECGKCNNAGSASKAVFSEIPGKNDPKTEKDFRLSIGVALCVQRQWRQLCYYDFGAARKTQYEKLFFIWQH